MKKKKMKKKVNTKAKKQNRGLIISCILIILVLSLIIGTSYALFSFKVSGKKTNYLKSLVFEVEFDDGSEYINLTNEGPKSDDEGMLNDPYTFTITNSGKANTINKIYFSDITSTIPDKYLKIAIKQNDGDFSTPMTMEEFGSIIEEGIELEPEHSVQYTIVLWISSDMPNTDEQGNSLMNTSYKSKITVESSQETKSNTTSTS
ncbi:MAG: hypothetical protein ACI4OT_00915 [Bacilli bacterium]